MSTDPEDAVHACWLDMDAARGVDLDRLAATLDADERRRAARFHFAADRRRYAVRWGKLRELLAPYLGCAPAAVRFARGAFGKPSLVAGAPRFNLAASRSIALYAIARDREVGCDVEQRDPRLPAEAIAEQFFSAREVRALRSLPPDRRAAAFFACWTRKEAYLKARGLGLSSALDGFDAPVDPDQPAASLGGVGAGWSVRSFEPVPGYPAAVVAPGASWRLILRQANPGPEMPPPSSREG